jgi:alpha-ketoglutarate-dependent taurine dioxygenase
MSELVVRDLSPSLGSEVRGLVPEIPLPGDVVDELRALFDDRHVLVFPDLDIEESFQQYLCSTLNGDAVPEWVLAEAAGEPEPEHKTQIVSNKAAGADAPYGRLLFHCDAMWARTPVGVISLYAVEVEEPTVPTLFVSMADAWDALPAELKERVGDLQARHGFEGSYPNRNGDEDVVDAVFPVSRFTTKPVANPHPRTGRTGLYVSEQATIEVLDLEPEENEALLAELFAHLYGNQQVLSVDWHRHDLIVWDNQAVQHARPTVALDGPNRTLRKCLSALVLDPDENLSMPAFSKRDNA